MFRPTVFGKRDLIGDKNLLMGFPKGLDGAKRFFQTFLSQKLN